MDQFNKEMEDKTRLLYSMVHEEKYDESRRLAQYLLKPDPNYQLSDASIASFLHYVLFFCDVKQGKTEDECMINLNEAIRLTNGLNPDLWYYGAVYQYEIGNWDKSLQFILKCCSMPDIDLFLNGIMYNDNIVHHYRWEFLEKLVKEHFPEKDIPEMLSNLNS